MMRTGVSGMSAQANKLATVSDNISNSDTTGYKRATMEFSSLINNSATSDYNSGGVEADVQYNIAGVANQGVIQNTTSTTDLAINGNGFFVVSNSSGTPFLTRAGAFVPDANGNLVNAAGFTLMGYDLSTGTSGVANGLSGLTAVNVNEGALKANPTNSGVFSANLPAGAAINVTGDTPLTNNATSTYTEKTSIVAYDNLGNAVTMDVYFTKTAANTWETTIFNHADATAGGFPYTGVTGDPVPLATGTLTFNPTSGNLVSDTLPAIPVGANGQNMTLDMSGMTQLGTGYTAISAHVNGNAPSPLDHVDIDKDGTLYAVYQDGTRVPTFKIPLANVPSPDNLTPATGNVYETNPKSGDPLVGIAGSTGLGEINSSSLEQSTVDLATELTNMIEAQRAYTANSKVFQTGSDLMDVVVNLRTQ